MTNQGDRRTDQLDQSIVHPYDTIDLLDPAKIRSSRELRSIDVDFEVAWPETKHLLRVLTKHDQLKNCPLDEISVFCCSESSVIDHTCTRFSTRRSFS